MFLLIFIFFSFLSSVLCIFDNVIIVLVSGMTSESLQLYLTPWIQELMLSSSFTFSARPSYPTNILSSTSSILYGVDPADSGILSSSWNGFDNATVQPISLPYSIFDVLSCQRVNTPAYAVLRNSALEPLLRRHCHSKCVDDCKTTVLVGNAPNDQQVVKTCLKLLERARPTILFVHLDSPSKQAETFGWNSYEHIQATNISLNFINQIKDSIQQKSEDSSILGIVIGDISHSEVNKNLTSNNLKNKMKIINENENSNKSINDSTTATDSDDTYKTNDKSNSNTDDSNELFPSHLNLPLFLFGKGVKQNYQIIKSTHFRDIAPTIVNALGLYIYIFF
eukprot:c6441_g1_i1.p1 GENE.c6441_g1_i1~~c6441_g1_i1.p1  ORF type:complete len:337 (-),score=82.04 c6441_g1_i1:13-1023(-)